MANGLYYRNDSEGYGIVSGQSCGASRVIVNEYICRLTRLGPHVPVLFPIVGKLKNDEYSYQGQTTTWDSTALPNMEFALEEQTKES